MAITFERAINAGRAAAVVADTLAGVIGKLVGSYGTVVLNVTDQPAGSDIFNGLGSSGSDVPISQLNSATFAVTGFYSFTANDTNGDRGTFAVICWPANALTVRSVSRGVLRSLAQHATQTGAETALENSPAAPYYGTAPTTLCGASSNSFYPYGGA